MPRGIDKSAIVAAAFAVLDDGGRDALTLRAVAARLNVQAPAIYHHMRNKQALLDEMGTEIHRRVIDRLTGRGTDHAWTEDLRAYANVLRDEYLAHRDGARTFSGTLITDPAVLAAQEPWLRRWVSSGIDATLAFDGFETVTAFVTGYVIEEQERSASAQDPVRYDSKQRARRLGGSAPLTAAAGYARADSSDRFARQLARVLDGLNRSGDPS